MRLHKEFGLNPTLPVCIICHEEKGEIALLGSAYKGEAPMRMLLDIEPCTKCKEKYLKDGVLLVEVEETADPNGKKRLTPTGAVTVLKDSAFKGLFKQDIPKGKIVQVEVGILRHIQEMYDEANKE